MTQSSPISNLPHPQRRNLLIAGAAAAAALMPGAAVRAASDEWPAKGGPVPHLIVDQPLADRLIRGVVLITFKTENIKILPVYGDTGMQVSPRVGHLHVTVDDASWFWIHATEEPIYYGYLNPGPHRVLIELAAPNHSILEAHTLHFDVPAKTGH